MSIVAGGLIATPRARGQSFGEALVLLTAEAATRVLVAVIIPEPVHRPAVASPEKRVELSDWVDPSTGSTARVGRSCEQRYVAYLAGTQRSNYLELKLFNDSAGEVVIAVRSPEFQKMSADPGKNERAPAPLAGHSGTYLSYGLDKASFYKLRHFEAVFEFSFANRRTCQAKLEFSRVLPALPSSFRPHFKTDLGLSAGLYVATGSLGDAIGQVGQSRAVAVSWFPAMQHGVRFEAGFDNLDSNRFALGVRFMPSYEYRVFFSPRLSYSFGIGAGAYLFTVRDDVPASFSRWALMVRQRMQLAVDLFPQWVSSELGPAVTFGVLPGGPFGPRELSGAFYTASVDFRLAI